MADNNQLAGDVEDPEFTLALAHVRQLVNQRAEGYGELFERVGELALTAGTAEPAAPQAQPEPVKFDPWAHTMRNPAHRQHTLGHHLGHKGVTDAASAVARRNITGSADLGTGGRR